MKQGNFFHSKLFLVLVVLALFSFLTLKNPKGIFDPLQGFFQAVFSPVQHAGSAFGYTFRSAGSLFEGVTALKNENVDLRKKNLELQAKNASLEQLASENTELRKNLELLPRGERQYIAATVLAKDPSGIQNFYTLDRGTNDEVREGMAVVVETGVLIGRVTKVFESTAEVTLITNQESLVNVETSNTAVRGIARGEQGTHIALDMVEQGKNLQEGDTIVTSGLGGVYPRGLLVGAISQLRFSEDKLFQQATISSPVRLNAIRFVFLIR